MKEEEIAQFIAEFLKAKAEHESKLRYNLNIIDELHANENAHTRILLKLLSYEQRDGKKIVLEDFISIINEHITDSEMKIKFSGKSKIFSQFNFIDGYIKSSDGWAIIIENKINWASDQQSQIDRYIQTVIEDGVSKDKIYVVYLTADGTKKVSEESFTKKGNVLGYVNENETGRFVELNYKDDILRLLKNLSSLDDEEKILNSAIVQYIDYLEGRFGMRQSEKEYNEAMNESLLKILNLSGSSITNAEKYEQIETLQWELWNRLDSLKHEVYPNQPNYIASQLRDFLCQNLNTVAPFDEFKLYQGTCILARAWSVPLSSEKNMCFAVDIGINSENTFSFNVHVIKGQGEWVDEKTFQKCLKEHEQVLNYLESKNSGFTNYGQSYELTGTFRNINDLEAKIKACVEELRKFF